MVVLCPNCGREIFSDPDSCVMCGWRRSSPQTRDRTEDRRPEVRVSTPRSPTARYSDKRNEARYREVTAGERRHKKIQREEYPRQSKPQSRSRYDDRYPQRMQRETRPVERREQSYQGREPAYQRREQPYQDRQPAYQRREQPSQGRQQAYQRREQPPQGRQQAYQRREQPPQGRQQAYQRREQPYQERQQAYQGRQQPYQERQQAYQGRQQPYQERQQPYQMRVVRETQSPRQGLQGEREPLRDGAGRGYREPRRHYCPNCSQEMFTDPDNCVLCGWSRAIDNRPARQRYEQRTYPAGSAPGYRRETRTGRLPEDWEKRVEDKIRARRAPQRDDRSWYRTENRAEEQTKATMDRFKCENCGNPTLQFFADGLGRCAGCGHRFRYSSKSTAFRSKHKQFICSKCDNKNLQFFTNGVGVCPHCKHEFKWKR